MSEEKENIVDKLNKTVLDFAESVFGESGRQFVEDTQEKVKEMSSGSVKKFMEFSDSIIENLNLQENEQVLKTRDSIEDLLKQAGLLKEDEEDF